MTARVDQIADRIYRLSTFVPEAAPGGFTFNQFLIDAPEPLLFHTGPRALFETIRAGIEQVLPVERLRWISFGHVEADECGAMNLFLEAAPQAQVVHGQLACLVSLNDMCDRPPRGLADGEVLELGEGSSGYRVVELTLPHVPHNWESHLLFEQKTGTLFSGDVCSQPGDGPAITDTDVIDAAVAAEELFHQTSIGPAIPAAFRRLADLNPTTVAVMHGSSYNGDCPAMLRTLADVFEQRFGCGPALNAAG